MVVARKMFAALAIEDEETRKTQLSRLMASAMYVFAGHMRGIEHVFEAPDIPRRNVVPLADGGAQDRSRARISHLRGP